MPAALNMPPGSARTSCSTGWTGSTSTRSTAARRRRRSARRSTSPTRRSSTRVNYNTSPERLHRFVARVFNPCSFMGQHGLKTRATFAIVGLAIVAVFAVPARAADDADFFPIMAWNHAPSDPAVLKKMAECGLTMAGFVYTKDLDAVRAAGMKGIVWDPRCANYDWSNVDAAKARENITSLVKEVN